MRINVVRLHVAPINPTAIRWLCVSITICMERWLSEVSRHC